MSSMKLRRRWVWTILLLGAVVCVIWFLPPVESEVQRLRAEL
jgi:lipopolysaccharide export system protein LptC